MNKRGRDEYENEIGFIMCGLPGNMGIEVSQVCIKRGLHILPIGLTVCCYLSIILHFSLS